MSRATDRNGDELPLCHRDRTTALLAYAVEQHATGHGQPLERAGDGPWDVWWVCYRAQCPAAGFGVDPGRAAGRCDDCAADVGRLALCTPPEHPDQTSPRRCSCLLDWARSMRQPAPDIAWPRWWLTVGMVKPGSDPVTVLVLLASPSMIGKAKDIKSNIRRLLGDGDALRNHLHMPDNPGDAFADLDHLAGTTAFSRLYERYERDRAAQRLARYRALLEQPHAQPRTG